MKKGDLKTGMQLVNRSGSTYTVFLDCVHGSCFKGGKRDIAVSASRQCSWIVLDNYDESLMYVGDDRGLDIIEVRVFNHPYGFMGKFHGPWYDTEYTVLWKRSDPALRMIAELEAQIAAIKQEHGIA